MSRKNCKSINNSARGLTTIPCARLVKANDINNICRENNSQAKPINSLASFVKDIQFAVAEFKYRKASVNAKLEFNNLFVKG